MAETITTPEQMREAAAQIAETHQVYQADVCAARIRAIPIAPQPVAVTVKPLVWNDKPSACLDCMCHDEFGLYQITDEFVLFAGHSTTGDKHFSIEQAQAAAQADYEARILSALTIQPADPLSDPRVKALVEAARSFLFAHDHGNGLEGWYNVREKLRAALHAIGGEA